MEKMRVAVILWGMINLFFTAAEAQTCLSCGNAANTGLNASALGTNAQATGEQSFAFGQNAKATQYRSIALGTSTWSSGMSALAIGNLVKSSGYNSITLGMGSATGYLENNISNSLMIGFNSTQPTLYVGPAVTTPYGIGKVGIGTTNPGEMLTVNGTIESKAGGYRFPDGSLQTTAAAGSWDPVNNGINFAGGAVGIGIDQPAGKLDVYGDIVLGMPGENFILHSRSWVGDALVIAPQNGCGGWDWGKGLTLKDNGQIYLGSELSMESAHQNYKLAVNGKVVCKELVVTLQNWADEVFEPGYILMPLGELKAFVEKYHHLPGVPGQQEVINNGIEIGEINRSLLARIEELSLYVIRLNEEIEHVKQTVKSQ